MVTIKVSDSEGIKFLNCFDTLDNVAYYAEEEVIDDVDEPDTIDDDVSF